MSRLTQTITNLADSLFQPIVGYTRKENGLLVYHVLRLAYQFAYQARFLVKILQTQFLDFKVGLLLVGIIDDAFQVNHISSGGIVDALECMANFSHETLTADIVLCCKIRTDTNVQFVDVHLDR